MAGLFVSNAIEKRVLGVDVRLGRIDNGLTSGHSKSSLIELKPRKGVTKRNTFNSDSYLEEYQAILQERLTHPTTWRQMTKVIKTNARSDHSPYISTMPSIQTGTRGTASTGQDFTITDTALTVSTYRELMVFIDRADEAQVNYPLRMELADRQGQLINEVIESLWLLVFADWAGVPQTATAGG